MRRIPVLAADGMLLLCALLWGTGFVAQRLGALAMGDTPFTFNAARYLIGAIALLGFVAFRKSAWSRATIIGGSIAGVAMAVGAALQQSAMHTVSAGTAGFITGTYVIWVPMIGLFLGQRVPMRIWAAVGITIVGLWFLTAHNNFIMKPAELLVLGCAFAWAAHVLIIGWAAQRGDALGIAFIQFLVAGVLSLGAAVAKEPISLELLWSGRDPIIFAGVLSTAVAFTLQVLAQTSAPPAHAAILLSLESVFAEFSGSIWMGESFDKRKWLGAGLILAGALIATVTGLRRQDPSESTRRAAPPAD